MAAPNIVNVATIKGNTAVLAVTTAAADIVANAASSGKVYKINTVIVSNVDGTNAADITGSLYRSGTEWNFASTISVPADSTLVLIDKSTALYLEEGDAIRLTASATGDLEAICSYEEIS
tara:strand:- start:45 stop:404 length:360 start_codon:yes stop_codon:yes gene_type:complete